MMLNEQESDRNLNLQPKYAQRVLIIDDSVDSVRLMSHILDHFKCDITMAFDGEDSVPLIINKKFDLIVLDWQMPQMGGRETLQLLDRLISEKQSTYKNHPIPVVIYTGTDQEELDLPHVQNFEYIGFINKDQPYQMMIKSFKKIFNAI